MQKQRALAMWGGRFPKGIVSALDPKHLDPEGALVAGTENTYPLKLGGLANFPKAENFISNLKETFKLAGTWQQFRIVGLGTWQPVPGKNFLAIAAYVSSETYGKNTFIFLAPNSDDASAQEGNIGWVVYLPGDAPVHFSQMQYTFSSQDAPTNHLIVCSAYNYVQMLRFDSKQKSVIHTSLPIAAGSGVGWGSRLWLTGALGYPNTVFYSEVNNVEKFNSFTVGDSEGEYCVGFQKTAGLLYVYKTNSLWVITSSDPATRSVERVLGGRGGLVYFPQGSSSGVLCCDERGLYAASGHYEQVQDLTAQLPDIEAERKDLVQLFNQVFVDSAAEFNDSGANHSNTHIEGWTVGQRQIAVLTLTHDAISDIDAQTVQTGTSGHAIGPTQTAYQRFKESFDPNDSYWGTELQVKLQGKGSCYVELIGWQGSDPDAPDSETVLSAGFISLNTPTAYAWYTLKFNDVDGKIFFHPSNKYKYLIRITGVSESTDWAYNTGNVYAKGEASWNSGQDACFKIRGYRYSTQGEWTSPWYTCNDVQRWGAYVYYALEKEVQWPQRVKLEYRFRRLDGTGTTAWQTFNNSVSQVSGGGLSNDWNTYEQIQIKVKLYKYNEIPPFVDWLLVTYSTELTLSETYHPTGFTHKGRIYLTGVKPDKDAVWVRTSEGGWFKWANMNLSHFIAWGNKLFAGYTGQTPSGIPAATVARLYQEEDSNCKYASSPIKIRFARLWADSPEVEKQPVRVVLSWVEDEGDSSAGVGVELSLYLVTDTGRKKITIDESDIESSAYANYSGVSKRKLKTARIFISDYIKTRTLGAELQAVAKSSVSGARPWFELISLQVEAFMWGFPLSSDHPAAGSGGGGGTTTGGGGGNAFQPATK